jgi:hypothetical protein
MNELVKAVSRYITRDLVYLVAGGAVLLTFFYARSTPLQAGADWPIPVYLLAAGIGYIVAYTVQDICCVLRIVSTAPLHSPWWPLRCLYRAFRRKPWQKIPNDVDFEEAEANVPECRTAEYERVIMYMQIGTTGGPCALVCAVLLALKVEWKEVKWGAWKWWGSDDFVLFVAAVLLGLALVLLGRLKAAQLARFLFRTSCRTGPPSDTAQACSAPSCSARTRRWAKFWITILLLRLLTSLRR